jgi:dihydroflavonol-4-reductase
MPVQSGLGRGRSEMLSGQPNAGYWSGRRVCVTGGTGFLGWHLAQQLLALGADVRVLALPPAAQHPVHREGRIEAVWGDVRDANVVRHALENCATVFHTAGFVGGWGRFFDRMWSVHVEGTRNVLAAAAAATGTRVVHTSSLTTIGPSIDGAPVTEDSPFNPDATKIAYVLAKRTAEAQALQAGAAGQDVVVTNPGYLVGPEDYEKSIMGRFCVRFWKGRLPVAQPGGMNLVDVRDVATGHLLAAERGQPGRRYLLGGEDHTMASFMRVLAAVAGYRPRGFPTAPRLMVGTVAVLAELRALYTRKEPYPSFDHVRLSRYCWYGSSQRAASELGYRARSLNESLRDAYVWHHASNPIHPRGINRWWVRATGVRRAAATRGDAVGG